MLRALPILLLAGLAGCTYNPRQDLSSDFGEAVHADMAAQVAYPVPQQTLRPPPTNGVRMNSAFQRYETGRVYKPEATQSLQGGSAPSPSPAGGGGGGSPTSDSGGGGGSGGGAGGAPSQN